MKEVERLMREILQEAESVDKIWVIGKNSKNKKPYQITRSHYESHKGDYILPKQKQVKPKEIQNFSEPKEPQNLSKPARNRKKTEKPNADNIKETYAVSPENRKYVLDRLQASQKWVDQNVKDQGDKQVYQTFKRCITTLVSDEANKQEKLKALTELVENDLIGTNNMDFGPKVKRKVYYNERITNIFPNKQVGGLISYKAMTSSGNPNALTNAITLFAHENGIDIPIYQGGFAKAQGEYNQTDTIRRVLLMQGKQVPPELDQKANKHGQLLRDKGGQAKRKQADLCNQKAAQAMVKYLDGKEITGVQQVGALGKAELAKRGIDDKKDPTDVIVYYLDENGEQKALKVSMKIYKNINAITVKAAGIKTAANYYLGEQAKHIDQQVLPQLLQKYNYGQEGISNNERAKRFTQFRKQYMQAYQVQMVKLMQSEQGQQKLLKMWRQVHGCGSDTCTCVSDMGKGNAQMRPPDYYCKPKMPFKVEYKGSKISIEFSEKGQKYLDIQVARSTNWGTSSLKFTTRHRNPPKEKKVRTSSKKGIKKESLNAKVIYDILLQMISKKG